MFVSKKKYEALERELKQTLEVAYDKQFYERKSEKLQEELGDLQRAYDLLKANKLAEAEAIFARKRAANLYAQKIEQRMAYMAIPEEYHSPSKLGSLANLYNLSARRL